MGRRRKSRRLTDLSYGLSTPSDLLKKLYFDGERLVGIPHPYDLFNFFITAAVLNEWIIKYYREELDEELKLAIEGKNPEKLPEYINKWVEENSLFPAQDTNLHLYISDSILICHEIANVTKHFHWFDESKVTAIEESPTIKDWYQYFFTSRKESVFVEFDDRYYSVAQIRLLLTTFYKGLIERLNSMVNKSVLSP